MKDSAPPDSLFAWQLRLCTLYQSFSYKGAAQEAAILSEMARRSGDSTKIGQSLIKKAFICLSAGFFREALDTLRLLRPASLPVSLRSLWFHTRARCYLDMAAYHSDPFYALSYKAEGLALLDSALFYVAPADTLYALSLAGLKALEAGHYKAGLEIYTALLQRPDLSVRQAAIEATSASTVWQHTGDEERAIQYLIWGAIADERSCVRESTALARVAVYLFQNKEYEKAHRYIHLALEDANFFGARLRQMQILKILPDINERYLALYRERRNQLFLFSLVLWVLLLACGGLIWLTVKQNRVLRHNEEAISHSYHQLEQSAKALAEANQIKEKYIGHFFQHNARLIEKMTTMVRSAKKEMTAGNIHDAKFYLDQFNPTYEQKKLLRDFDRSFLSIFPSFVEEFNLLFEEKDRLVLEEELLLTTELRIFALMRLGVTNNEVIAKALHYSVNTIYAYKTKVRNRSVLPADIFDAAVMRISAMNNDAV